MSGQEHASAPLYPREKPGTHLPVVPLIILVRSNDECLVLKFFAKTPSVVSFNVRRLLSAGYATSKTEIASIAHQNVAACLA